MGCRVGHIPLNVEGEGLAHAEAQLEARRALLPVLGSPRIPPAQPLGARAGLGTLHPRFLGRAKTRRGSVPVLGWIRSFGGPGAQGAMPVPG